MKAQSTLRLKPAENFNQTLKIMKNNALILAFVGMLLSQNSFAKTQGSYVGIDLLDTNIKFHERYTNDSTPEFTDRRPSFSDSDYGVGLHYSYALNAAGLFIAPGLIFEFNNADAQAYGERELQKVKVQNRYGAKLDIGFDLTPVISPYLTGGYIALSHKNREYFDNYQNSRTRSATSMDWIYGAGIMFNCDKYTAINIEYTIQEIDLRNTTDGAANKLISRYRTRIDVLKFGVSYRF